MKKINTKIIEQMKTILLVVLFFTTVLLLYYFWENATREPMKLADIMYSPEVEEAPDLYQTVVPNEITVGFGNEVYTVILNGREALWDKAVKELKAFGDATSSQTSNLPINEITKEKYLKATQSQYSSIQFQFHYDIPFKEFCGFYDIRSGQAYDKIDYVSTIAYSAMSPESILIYQRTNDKYYAIIADKDYTQFSSMIAAVENGSYASYYPATKFFGSGVKNNALMPLALQSDLTEVEYEKETNEPEDEKVRDLAESFFGESFDFTRKLKDTKGNIIYMYGYGKKTFSAYANGTFEYKEETETGSSGQPHFFDSLDAALKFVASHGSWNSLDGTDMSAYLGDVIPIGKDRKKGYKFIFQMKIGSQNVYFEDSAPIVVDVVNNQVTYYRRDMIDFDKSATESYSSGELKNTFDPVTVLTEHYEYIYEKLAESGAVLPPIEEKETAFDEIARKVTAVEIGYVRPKQMENAGSMVLRPCYRISFGRDVILYFDLFNEAEPIGAEITASPQDNVTTGGIK